MDKFKRLEDYLEEIDHYLVVEKGGEEILAEIRSHIMEKAVIEYGEHSEESVGNHCRLRQSQASGGKVPGGLSIDSSYL